MSLTVGTIQRIVQNEDIPNPIVQVIAIKAEKYKPEGPLRVHLVVSDSQNFQHAVLSTQLNFLHEENKLKENAFVCLKEYTYSVVNGERGYIVIMNMSVVSYTAHKIGNPVELLADGSPAMNTTQMNPSKQSTANPAGNLSNQYGKQQQRTYPPQAQSAGAVVKEPQMIEGHVVPVMSLSPYSNRWTIKCRVMSKSAIRSWDKGPQNQGKLFSVDLLDKEGGEIRATFFRDGVDKYYDMLQEGKVFLFSGGQVKVANTKFNTTNSNYEISFGSNADIIPVYQDNSIKEVSLKPTKISFVTPELTSLIDVLGVVVNQGNVESFVSKAGRDITKLDVFIADDSNEQIKVTLFGEKCNEFVQNVASMVRQTDGIIVVGFKAVKVSDFEGCSLSCLPSSNMYVNPDVPEKQKLLRWASGGIDLLSLRSKSVKREGGLSAKGEESVESRKTLDVVKLWAMHLDLEQPNFEMENGSSEDQSSLQSHLAKIREKGEYVNTKATVTFIKRDNMWYPACPEEGNNRKVILQPDGSWFCESTGKHYDACQYRYILTVLLSDQTSGRWVTCFNDVAEKVLGYSANDLQKIRETNEDMFESILVNALFKEYLFRMRIAEESFNEEKRLRCTALRVDEIQFSSENKKLLEFIQTFA